MERDTNKLPKYFKARWIAALRSGEYKQSCHTIHNKEENSFCCIGVAAIVYGHDPGSEQFNIDGYVKLPDAIARGFRNPRARMLMDMNDDGKSFSKIADYIEANL